MNDIKNIAIVRKLAADNICYGYIRIILFTGAILMIIEPYADTGERTRDSSFFTDIRKIIFS
ncbi:MAG: hypothetical protein Q7T80_08555 [Methanoregula sp.]|nr:hypothetical protein [Methanoregula sp.]